MNSCVVRYPKRVLVIAGCPLLIAVLGFAMVVVGKGRWTLESVAAWAGFGILFLLYIARYKTVFSSDHIRQYQFLRPARDYSYQAVQDIHIGHGKSPNAIILTFADGRRVKVYGAEGQLQRAQELLRLKLHIWSVAFENIAITLTTCSRPSATLGSLSAGTALHLLSPLNLEKPVSSWP